MLIQLFRANSNNFESVYDKWMMPLDLCSLATYIQNIYPNIDIEIIDGQTTDENILLSKINPDAALVGITYTVFSVDSMEKIARIANSNGSLVVVGGHAATASAENLITNKDIKAVVKFDGEIPLSMIIGRLLNSKNKKIDFSDIPNTVFKANSEIVYGPVLTCDINSYPTIKRQIGGVNIENYVNAYHSTCTEKMLITNRPTNAYSKKGCPKSCSFCGRIDKTFRPRLVKSVYYEFSNLANKYKVDYIYDHSDTWINREWMNDFENLYNSLGPLDLRYMIFGDVRDINYNISKQLKGLGVDIILLGLESGSEQLLKNNGKKLKVDEMKSCISMLAEHNIKVSASFVFGMIGETDKSIDETLSFISQIKSLGEVTIYANLIIPLPGSWQWKLMMQDPTLHSAYWDKYSFDIDILRDQYLRKFTNVHGGLDYLREIRDMILRQENMPILEYAR